MATSTILNKQQEKLVIPRDDELYTREGFDRRGLRRELAAVNQIGLNDTFIETGDKVFLDPRHSDMPVGPNLEGETGGSGIELMREQGKNWDTYRFTQGFTTLQEQLEAGADSIAQQRRDVMEMFDFFFDASFLKGLDDEKGNQIEPGVFNWLKTNIPTERTFDAATYADGTNADYDATGTQENLIKYDAYKTISGNLLTNDSAQWGMMIGRQEALAQFNKITEGDYNKQTYWERLNAPNAKGGIASMNLIPDQLQYSKVPEGMDPLTVDLTSELGSDEVILLPSLNKVADKYWMLHEQGTPRAFDPIPKEGGQTRFDYAARYTHQFDPLGQYGNVEDAVHITNVSALFK